MPIEFSCPHCGSRTVVGDSFAGQSGPCKSCGNSVTVPAAAGGYVYGGPPGSYGPPRKSSPALLIGLIVGGLALLICCGGGFAFVAWFASFGIAGARAGAETVQCKNNLRQIAVAIHNYHDVHNRMPPLYSVDAAGEPLHSWRVHILPFLDDGLYRQIRLDEPWDSPHNRMFHDQMPQVFRCPSDAFGTSATNYMAIGGEPGAALRPEPERIQLQSFIDGTSNTILIVEVAGSGVNWMSPVDLELQGNYSINGTPDGSSIAGNHPGGANVVMADAQVVLLEPDTPAETVKALITRNGNEIVGDF